MKHISHFLRTSTPMQTLALTLALLLLLPVASVPSSPSSPFTAQAQINIGGCNNKNPGQWLIDVNGDGLTQCGSGPDLRAFEDSVISEYITLHQLTVDKNYLLTYGSPELRNDLRAQLVNRLAVLIAKPAASRTAAETAAYNWLSGIASDFETQTYQGAVNLYNTYKANPCAFKLDADIASTYNVVYNTSNCSSFGRFNVFNFNDHQPSADYYIASATKATWGKVTLSTDVVDKMAEMNRNITIAGTAAGLVGGAAAAATAALAINVLTNLLRPIYVIGQGYLGLSATTATAGFATGPFFIVMIAIQILTQAALDFSNVQAVKDGLTNMINKRDALVAGNFDLTTLNTTDNFYKIEVSVLKGTSGELATPYPSLPARDGLDPYFSIPQNLSRQVAFKDIKGRYITASLYNGMFKRELCQAFSTNNCPNGQTTDTTPALLATFTLDDAASGNTYTVSRSGNGFFVSWVNAPDTAVACPADTPAGFSNGAYSSNCSTFYTNRIPGLANGLQATIFTLVTAPTFASKDFQTFTAGTAKSITIKTDQNVPLNRGVCSGDTAPTLVRPLPTNNGISFSGEGTNQLTITYNPALGSPTAGNYDLNVCAQYIENGIKLDGTTQNLVIAFNTGAQQKPQFIEPSVLTTSVQAWVGIPFSINIKANGNPAPRFSIAPGNNQDPASVIKITDNLDGTATLTGTIPIDSRYNPLPACNASNNPNSPGNCLAVIADNGVDKDIRNFQFRVDYQDASAFQLTTSNGTIGTPTSARWIAGQSNSLKVVTYNSNRVFNTPSISMQSARVGSEAPSVIVPDTSVKFPIASAPWLSIQDLGDGTAIVKGTPPVNSFDTVDVNLIARNSYARYAEGFGFTIFVDPVPVLLTSTGLDIVQGGTGAITLLNSAQIQPYNLKTRSFGDLPTGITLEGSGRNWLFRVASSVTPGSYRIPVRLKSNNSRDVITEFNVNVLGTPDIYSLAPGNVNRIRVHAGTSIGVDLDLQGLPKSALPAAGSTVIQLLSSRAVSSSVSYKGLNFLGVPTGTGKLRFAFPANTTPTSFILRFRPVTCTAGTACPDAVPDVGLATYNFTVQVVAPGDATGDGMVSCADVTLIRSALGKNVSQVGYDVNADVNLDGVVDIKDLSFVSSKQRPGTVCP